MLTKDASDEAKEIVEKGLDNPYNSLKSVRDRPEQQQLAIQRFSQMARGMMMKSGIEWFVENLDSIVDGTFDGELTGKMSLSGLCRSLKEIMKSKVYTHVEIANREQATRTVIHGLLNAIVDELRERPGGALAQSVYRDAKKNPGDRDDSSADYMLALRATDYVSGMTDGFALATYRRISAMCAQL